MCDPYIYDADPIAYTYDAAYHCPGCAFQRFGIDASGFVPENELDSESNPLGAVAPWDEWQSDLNEPETLACDTCGEVIEEYDPED